MTEKYNSTTDIWKGLGIIAVVMGHLLTFDAVVGFIYCFHMPLFFFISGYLFKKSDNYPEFFKKKAFHLMMPYFAYGLIFNIPKYITLIAEAIRTNSYIPFKILQERLLADLYGGVKIGGFTSVFWFVTCLFLTQQLYNLIYTVLPFQNRNILMFCVVCVAYIIGMINSMVFPDFVLPWNAHVVPMAFVFLWAGHSYRQLNFSQQKTMTFIAGTLTIITIGIYCFTMLPEKLFQMKMFEMKTNYYGIPIINMIVGVGCIITIRKIADILSKYHIVSLFFSQIGQASMVIMYLHMPFQIIFLLFFKISDIWFRFVSSLILSFTAFFIMKHFRLMRRLFMGEFSYSGFKGERNER